MIRLMVVDDSAFMRIAIAKMVENDPKIELVGSAHDGKVAVEMAQRLRPDVITMDVEMPVLNGLQAVQQIMESAPCPIIMVSSLTTKGGEATIKALELGAVDFIAKSSSFVQLDIVKIENELQEKIYYWAAHPLNLARKTAPPSSSQGAVYKDGSGQSRPQTGLSTSRRRPLAEVDCVVVGVSTGGPKAVLELLTSMGKLSCPMVIAQHMPKEFTPGFAEHLAFATGLNVVEGRHAMVLEAGQVVVAPGGTDSQIRSPFGNHYALDVKPDAHITLHPSADLLFKSAARTCKSPVAVVLTGMGEDGASGALEFAQRDYPVLVQEPSTCVVDGMPGSAIANNAVSQVLELELIGEQLQRWCGARSPLMSRRQS